jgi:cytoskeletal protein CcmA (bactofilin family)
MFRFGKSPDKFETILGPQTSFDGHLKCEGGVRVEGEAKGSISATGNIIVGKAANVAADLQGRDVLVSGRVEGRIVAQGQLAILASGQVNGDVEVGSILIEEGGVLNGKSTIRE